MKLEYRPLFHTNSLDWTTLNEEETLKYYKIYKSNIKKRRKEILELKNTKKV